MQLFTRLGGEGDEPPKKFMSSVFKESLEALTFTSIFFCLSPANTSYNYRTLAILQNFE